MTKKTSILALLIACVLMMQGSIAEAQTTTKSRKGSWSGLAKTQTETQELRLADTFPGDDDANGKITPQDVTDTPRIVGTWLIRVPDAPDAPGFSALQTFHLGGTFTETSDLLGQLPEGPSHGAWSGKKSDYRLTFQLFGFDEDGLPTGRIQVRCTIRLLNDNQLTATATVDIIEPNGNIIPAVATSPFTGSRVQIVPE